MRAGVNKGPPPLAIQGPLLPKKMPPPLPKAIFSTDLLVAKMQQFPWPDSKAGSPHPLANLIGWQYLMGGREQASDDDARKVALDYAFHVTKNQPVGKGFILQRLDTPEDSVRKYWELYEDFMLPNGETMKTWHEDLLEHIVKINYKYGVQYQEEDPLMDVFNHEALVQVLARNMADGFNMDDREGSKNHEILRAIYRSALKDANAGLKKVCKQWLDKFGDLPSPQEENVYDERRTRWRLRSRDAGAHAGGSVLDFCSRAITQFANRHVKRYQIPKRGGSQVTKDYYQAGSANRFRLFKLWGLIGLAPPRIDELQGKATLDKNFFGNPGCVRIFQNFGKYPEHEANVQRLLIYSDVDTTKGILKMHEMVQRGRGRREDYDVVLNATGLHRTLFTREEVVPWRLVQRREAVGDFPADSCKIEVTNYELVLELFKALEALPAPAEKQRAQKRLREPEERAVSLVNPKEKASLGPTADPRWPAMPSISPARTQDTPAVKRVRIGTAGTLSKLEESGEWDTAQPPNYMLWGGAIMVGIAGLVLVNA